MAVLIPWAAHPVNARLGPRGLLGDQASQPDSVTQALIEGFGSLAASAAQDRTAKVRFCNMLSVFVIKTAILGRISQPDVVFILQQNLHTCKVVHRRIYS